jgi:hypothetical protein
MAPNPLTYPSSSKPFTKDVFLDPPREYRGAPFWAWNHKQEEKATVAQVGNFDEMGMGGFHMHTRVGLDIPYMGDEYMKIVKSCVNKAKEKGMYAFLYDEDRLVEVLSYVNDSSSETLSFIDGRVASREERFWKVIPNFEACTSCSHPGHTEASSLIHQCRSER